VLFASDIDSTLVYPARTQPATQPTEPVEVRDGRVITCASVELRPALAELAAAGVALVPVTARSWEQLTALTPLRHPRLAITAGGGRIWRDGRPVTGWDRVLTNSLGGAATVEQARRELSRRLGPAAWVVGEQFIESRFFLLLAPHGELPADAEALARDWLAGVGWTAYAHGRKLYCLPSGLRKDLALAWLVDTLGERLLAAAGDSEMDASLLAMADVAFCPRGSSLAGSPLRPANARVTRADCAAAGPEIVRAVAGLAGTAGTGGPPAAGAGLSRDRSRGRSPRPHAWRPVIRGRG
jgi:hydroxymethylpyrimidine pyrophosphatase-like HAD family hydrolase